MKTIITTVGTSLFENYNKKEVEIELGTKYDPIFTEHETLRDKRFCASEYDEEGTEEEKITRIIKKKWLQGITKKNKLWVFEEEALNEYASAEIESILAIQREASEDVEVYLLATDTVLSRLAVELICAWFSKYGNNDITIKFNPNQDVIKKLQIEDATGFKEGLVNLNTRFYQIAQNLILAEQYNSVIINVTGGYKGIIPYLTILGQINKSPIKYIFENTGVLITIPQIPIQLNEELFEQHWEILARLEHEVLKSSDHYQLIQDLGGCFEIDNQGEFMFNYLGNALWSRYKSKFFIFYAPDDVWAEIKTDTRLSSIFKQSFVYEDLRNSNIKSEQTHKTVFKKPHDKPRIYFFYDDSKIYVYQAFLDHDLHKKYITKTPFNDTLKYCIMTISRLQKIQIK